MFKSLNKAYFLYVRRNSHDDITQHICYSTNCKVYIKLAFKDKPKPYFHRSIHNSQENHDFKAVCWFILLKN